MIKLITPVQYQEPLGELNSVRPLLLADEIKHVIDYPVLSRQPATSGSPIEGRLLRCTEQACPVIVPDNTEKQYDQYAKTFEVGAETWAIDFGRKVDYVQVRSSLYQRIDWLGQTTPDYTQKIFEIPENSMTFLPFKGQVIHFWANTDMGASGVLIVWGFY